MGYRFTPLPTPTEAGCFRWADPFRGAPFYGVLLNFSDRTVRPAFLERNVSVSRVSSVSSKKHRYKRRLN